MDPHVWLSPKRMRTMVLTAQAALEQAGVAVAPERLASTLEAIGQVQALAASRFAPHQGKRFAVFHPSFAYLAKDFGLKQLAVEHEGKAPTARQLKQLSDSFSEAQITTLFVQPQFESRSTQALARVLEADVVTLDALAKDWPQMMSDLIHALAASFTPSA
jgi:zinc transport system substrate-binding protein